MSFNLIALNLTHMDRPKGKFWIQEAKLTYTLQLILDVRNSPPHFWFNSSVYITSSSIISHQTIPLEWLDNKAWKQSVSEDLTCETIKLINFDIKKLNTS